MTFYNHIESVRSIAIDLTNGRKWRGASDKTAVFDALDAARREYMRLSDENAALREDLEDQEGYDQMLRDRLRQQTELCVKAEAENAKLQASNEVIAEDHAALCEHNAKLRELLDYMTPIAWYAASERERNRMRELGIEVES